MYLDSGGMAIAHTIDRHDAVAPICSGGAQDGTPCAELNDQRPHPRQGHLQSWQGMLLGRRLSRRGDRGLRDAHGLGPNGTYIRIKPTQVTQTARHGRGRLPYASGEPKPKV